MTINAPRPWQLTVGELREALKGAHENSVIALSLPGGFSSPDTFTEVVYNLGVGRTDGPLIKLTVSKRGDADDHR